MTAPAPTLYEAVGAERASRLDQPLVAPFGERAPTLVAVSEPAPAGPWASFLAAFDRLLDAHRRGDADQVVAVRDELADLRARLALGGVAVPAVSRHVPVEPSIDPRRMPSADAR